MAQMNIILALSLLLAVGFALAYFARLARLPSVTGYILAGILLGPSGFNLIGKELIESRLEIFTDIALLLVAFGIGERFDLQQLRHSAKTLVRVSLGESAATFLFVTLSVGIVAWVTGAAGTVDALATAGALSLVCGSIAVATAPATTVAVIREIEASGPVTRLVLSSVVVDNVLSLTMFGITVAAARTLLGTAEGSGVYLAVIPVVNSISSLALGIAVGLATDLLVHRLRQRSEVLIVALAAIFLCGGLASFLGLSSLLAGVAAGFAVVNRDRRDVRAFRALNDFEPPLYGVFFALAGAQLNIGELATGGLVGIVFVVGRITGKYLGSWWGAHSAGLTRQQSTSVGLGLLPQAGLAIALAYLIRQDDSLNVIRAVLLNVVIASVVVNELIGPPMVRCMAVRADELPGQPKLGRDVQEKQETRLAKVPTWKGSKLIPPGSPERFVMAGLGYPGTAAGVTRIATLLSHQFQASPLAVHVVTGSRQEDFWRDSPGPNTLRLFQIARDEARQLGYQLSTMSEFADETAEGILRVTESHKPRAIVLGHPSARRAPAFAKIVDAVARNSECPLVVIKFSGDVRLQKILVPLCSVSELSSVEPVLRAMTFVRDYRITLLRMMPRETLDKELKESERELARLVCLNAESEQISIRAVAAESRIHTILETARQFDLVIMSANNQRGLRRAFFGSLAEDIAQRVDCTMLLVRGGI